MQIEVHLGGRQDEQVWDMMDILNSHGMVVFNKKNIAKKTKAVEYGVMHLAPRPDLLRPRQALSSDAEAADFFSEYSHLHKTERAICGRILVFDCNLVSDCGGLADRMAGTITAAMVSILTNRSFVLHQDYFNESFQPANPDVDWRWSKELENCTRNAGPVLEFVNKDHAWNDFLEHFGDRPIVRVRSNRGFLHGLLDHPRFRMQLAKWGLTKCNIFGRIFDGLFKPTQALTSMVQKFLPWHGDFGEKPTLTVGMHFRLGDASFDPRVAALAVGRDVMNFWDLTFKCARSATSAAVALWGAPVQVRYFVMTDHAGLKNYIRANHSKDHVLLSDMAPVHINGKEYRKYHTADDKDHAAQRLAVMQTYAEWYAYSLSNLFILSPRPSGFSRLSIMRALASRHPRFPEYGVIHAQACSAMGHNSCKVLGQEGAKVL